MFYQDYYIIVKESPGKGLGVFAKRDLVRGTRIIAEAPLFHVPEPDNEWDVEDVKASVDRLSPDDLQAFFNLHSPVVSEEMGSEAEQIFRANSFSLGDIDGAQSASICLLASRLNHSCTPNTYHFFDTNSGKLVVQLVQDIKKDEEISICYVGIGMTQQLRKLFLQALYSFECQCPACSQEEGSEAWIRRERIAGLLRDIAKYNHSRPTVIGRHQDANNAYGELVVLLQLEGLYGGILASTYGDASRLALANKDMKRAMEWANLEVQTKIYCMGKDSDRVEAARAWIELQLSSCKDEGSDWSLERLKVL